MSPASAALVALTPTLKQLADGQQGGFHIFLPTLRVSLPLVVAVGESKGCSNVTAPTAATIHQDLRAISVIQVPTPSNGVAHRLRAKKDCLADRFCSHFPHSAMRAKPTVRKRSVKPLAEATDILAGSRDLEGRQDEPNH